MTNDAKEWVTIKVPEEQRDAARERPETYGEVLAAGVEALANGANGTPRLDEMGELDAEEIATRLKDELSMVNEPGVEVDVDGMVEKLERIESAAQTAEERTGRIEQALEDMGARR